MTTISAPDLALLRTQQQQTTLYLSVLQPFILLTASVNNGAITRGARTIDYDGGVAGGVSSFAAIAAGQTLEVDTPKGTQKIRIKSIAGVAAAGTITVAENTISWADDMVIRVLHNYEPWPIPPTIRAGIFYKDYDIGHTDQTVKPPPVAILGPNFVTTSDYIEIDGNIATNGSYAISDGATISSLVLTCLKNDGTTVVVNQKMGIWDITFPSCGQYWLTLVATDSNGKTAKTHRCVWYYDFVTCSPYIDFQMTGLSGDWGSGGWRFSINVTGDVKQSDFPDNSLVVVWCINHFNSSEDYVNIWHNNINFEPDKIMCQGYIRNDNDRDSLADGVGSVSFEVTTIEAVMDKMSLSGSVSLNAITTIPAYWYEYEDWMTVGRAIHHLLQYHSTIMEIVDVYGLKDNVLGLKTADFAESTLLQMCNSLTNERGILAKVVSDRLGRLHLVEDTQLWNDTDRAALDTVFTLSIADVSDTVELVRQQEEAMGVVEVSGFFFDGAASTPYISIASGYQAGGVSFGLPNWRGSGSDMRNFQVLASQADCNEKAGRLLAAANNEYRELRITSPANYLGAFDIVPSIGMYNWGLADALFKRGLGLNGLNLICRNVSANMIADGVLQSNVVFEIEAQGEDGIPGNYPVGYPPIAIPPPPIAPPGEGWFLASYTDRDAGPVDNTKVVYIEPDGTIQTPEPVISGAGGAVYVGGMTRLSSLLALVVIYDGTAGKTKGFLVTLSTAAVVGAEQELFGTAYNIYCLETIDSTRALMLYGVSAAPNYNITAVVITNTGGILSVGAPTTVYSFATGGVARTTVSLCILSSTAAVVSYCTTNSVTGLGPMSARVLSINGTSITSNAAVDSVDASGSYYSFCTKRLNSSQAIIGFFYEDFIITVGWKYAVLTVSGATLSWGNTYELFSSLNDTSIAYSAFYGPQTIERITDTSFVVVCGKSQTADKYAVRAIAASVSESVISAGSIVSIVGDTNFITNPRVATIPDTNRAIVTFVDGSTFSRNSIAVSGTVVTDNSDTTTGESVLIVDNGVFLNSIK